MEPERIRLLLIDDHSLFREGVVRLLNAEPGFDVVRHCATADEGLEAVRSGAIDIVLLDIDLGKERGSRFMLEARRLRFPGKVLVVTAGISEAEGVQLLRLGVNGIFLKHRSPELLVQAIRAVREGKRWLDEGVVPDADQVAELWSPPEERTPLTERERLVLKGVFEGLANKEIAARLYVSESSVKMTLQQLFDKTGVRTRTQLTRVALERYLDQI